jgi:hypothetical protein
MPWSGVAASEQEEHAKHSSQHFMPQITSFLLDLRFPAKVLPIARTYVTSSNTKHCSFRAGLIITNSSHAIGQARASTQASLS